jgi:hypothetical protein
MITSIINQLKYWLEARRDHLVQAGVVITDRLPRQSSDVSWKGTVGLVKDDIFVSFTVWERMGFQTELIIVDGSSGKTLQSDDATPGCFGEIETVLDSVVDNLISGNYRKQDRSPVGRGELANPDRSKP